MRSELARPGSTEPSGQRGAARSGQTAVTVLSLCLLGGLALALCLALLVPLYNDEIGSKSTLTRALIDDGRVSTLFPQCRTSYEHRLWPGFLPAAAFYYAIFSWSGLLSLKISGVVIAVGCIAFAARAVARGTDDRSARIRRFALLTAPITLGVLPFTFVMARSEPLMVLIVSVLVALPLVREGTLTESVLRRLVVAVAYAFLASVSLYSHPKMILFTPFVLVSLAATFSARRFLGLVVGVGAVIVANAAAAYRTAKLVVQCDEVPEVAQIFKSMTLDLGVLRTDPRAVISAGMMHLYERPADLARQMAFQVEYPSHWLPSNPGASLAPGLAAINVGIRVVLLATVFASPALVVTGFALCRERLQRRALVLSAALLACIGFHLFMANLQYNFYNAAFVFPVFTIVDALAIWAIAKALPCAWWAAFERTELVGIAMVQIVALGSLVALFLHLGLPVLRTARYQGTMLPGQPASVPVFGYSVERAKIRDLAARCAIAGDGASHLVIDDATLFAFDNLREPIHLVYVTDVSMWAYAFPGEKALRLLHDLGSRGLVTRCNFLPTALVDRVRRDGDYCCAGPDELR